MVWLPTTISGVPHRAVIHLDKISSRQGLRAGVGGGWERARTREQGVHVLPGGRGLLALAEIM